MGEEAGTPALAGSWEPFVILQSRPGRPSRGPVVLGEDGEMGTPPGLSPGWPLVPSRLSVKAASLPLRTWDTQRYVPPAGCAQRERLSS